MNNAMNKDMFKLHAAYGKHAFRPLGRLESADMYVAHCTCGVFYCSDDGQDYLLANKTPRHVAGLMEPQFTPSWRKLMANYPELEKDYRAHRKIARAHSYSFSGIQEYLEAICQRRS